MQDNPRAFVSGSNSSHSLVLSPCLIGMVSRWLGHPGRRSLGIDEFMKTKLDMSKSTLGKTVFNQSLDEYFFNYPGPSQMSE